MIDSKVSEKLSEGELNQWNVWPFFHTHFALYTYIPLHTHHSITSHTIAFLNRESGGEDKKNVLWATAAAVSGGDGDDGALVHVWCGFSCRGIFNC